MAKKREGLSGAVAPMVTGTQFESIDHAAIQAQDRMKRDHEGPGSMASVPYDWEQHRKDWHAIEKLQRRGNRGGAAVRKGHMTGC